MRRLKLKAIKQDTAVILFTAFLGNVMGQITSNTILPFSIALCGVLYSFFRSNNNIDMAFTMMMVLAYDFFGLVPFLSIGAGTLHWYDINVIFAMLLYIKCFKQKKRNA